MPALRVTKLTQTAPLQFESIQSAKNAMGRTQHNKPDFLIIGAQKAGTTWLWRMLEQHPGTSLPKKKEIHFFGSAELYRNGLDWYYSHFAGLDHSRVVGEASTTYFYDSVPYWFNPSAELQVDYSLPTVPELVSRELPHVKILIILRDPVRRAVSAYHHYVRTGIVSPMASLKDVAIRRPKTRIVEYGYYAKYIQLWRQFFPPNRLCILVFEEDVLKTPERTLRNVYEFLNLDLHFTAAEVSQPVYKRWSWTRLLLAYYADPLSRRLLRSRAGNALDRFDFLQRFATKPTADDIEFLRSKYLPERKELESLTGRNLSYWTYDV